VYISAHSPNLIVFHFNLNFEMSPSSHSRTVLAVEWNVGSCDKVDMQLFSDTVIPRLTKIIRSGITFVSRNVISHRLSGVSLLAVSNVNNPVGLVGLPYVMWSAHFFVTHIQTEKISSWNGPTVHVCCFMLARASTKTFVSRVRKTAKRASLAEKIVSRVTR
jgi:hypothetical protein